METVIEFVNKLASQNIKLSIEEGRISYEDLDKLIINEQKKEIIKRSPEIIALITESDYWSQQFVGGLPSFELISGLPRKGSSPYKAETITEEIPVSLFNWACEYPKSQSSAIYLALFQLLLNKYTRQDNILVGVPTIGSSSQSNVDETGSFINMLPISTYFGEQLKLDELISKVQTTISGAYKHSQFSVKRIVDKLNAGEESFSYQAYYQYHPSLQQASDIKLLADVHKTESIDLGLEIFEKKDSVCIHLKYNSSVYTQSAIKSLFAHYCVLLTEINNNPDLFIDQYAVITAQEKQQLLIDANQTQSDYPKDKCIHQLFVEQVKRNPEKTAIIFQNENISYQTLYDKSNDLALYLQKQGVKPGSLVGLCVERSLDMMVAMLGILQAGGAYVPLDPSYPTARLSYMLKDSKAKILITQERLLQSVGTFSTKSTKIITIDQQWLQISKKVEQLKSKGTELQQKVKPSDLAYVIYTSGSTGNPKGVMVEHGSVVNFLHTMADKPGITNEDKLLAVTTYCFDIAVLELYLPLIYGAQLCICATEDTKDGEQLQHIIEQYQPTIMQATPATWQVLFYSGWTNKEQLTILCGGEALSESLKNNFTETDSTAWNMFGPTETTIWSTIAPIVKDKSITIGFPIANTQIYILDNYNNPVPVGVAGELHIAGDGLARGYLNRSELTQEKFIDNPFEPETRMYKSGDLARWLDDGRIEYLGRIDTQVKIRGFRIEIGEIETRLNEYPGIKNSVVVAQGQEGNKKLIAFYLKDSEKVSITQQTNHNLKAHLLVSMPEFMLPATFVNLSVIPLTANGKVDRRALEQMHINIESSQTYKAPSNDTEKLLVDIWAKVLKLNSEIIGVNDNFFELGGQSLLATQVISRVRGKLSINLKMSELFKHTSIVQLAKLIIKTEKSDIPVIEPINRKMSDYLALSFAQNRLWVLDQLQPDSANYNLPVINSIKGELDSRDLEQALNLVIARHDILRSIFPSDEGKAKLQILDSLEIKLETVDLSRFKTSKTRIEKAKAYCQKEVVTPFNLAKGPLIRAKIVKLTALEHIFIINMHHIISDGWSLDILIDELSFNLYKLQRGETPQLPPLTIQYVDYCAWQSQWLDQGVLKQQLCYWQEKLAGVPDSLDMPTDYPRPNVQNSAGAGQVFSIDSQLTEQLKSLAEKQGCTLYMVLLAVFKVLLHRYTSKEDICIGSPIANRQYGETEQLIGMFVNTLPLRSFIAQDDIFSEVLTKVKNTCLEAYENQDAPFDKIVDVVISERDIAINPLFQIMVVLQNASTNEIADHQFQPYTLDRSTSKFDITVEFTKTPDGLAGIIEFSTALYKQQTIERMCKHFISICYEVTRIPEGKINNIDLLDSVEKQQLLLGFNSTQANYDKDKCIHELFFEQVKRNPKQIAAIYKGDRLSYKELYDKSQALALYLQAEGVTPDSLIGICLERSLDMIVAILGIVQAGGAYVPLDPDYPDDRLAYMAEDSQIKLILTQDKLKEKLYTIITGETRVISLEGQWSEINTCVVDLNNKGIQLKYKVTTGNLAYLIYTSGTTGKPKGVMVEHQALVNRICWMQSLYSLSEEDTVLQKTPYSFDVSVWEFFWPMISGATVVFTEPDGHKNVDYLQTLINKEQVTTLHFVPSMFTLFLDSATKNCKTVRQVFCSGEALSKTAVDLYKTKFPNALLHNLYGPTEAAIDVTAYDCTHLETHFVPIGSPIANTQIYILDQHNKLQPIGVPGELHIAGDGLARGYLNRQDLTREKFVANPFNQGSRMYKTGDLARWNSDGNIEYLGRIDTQVKIRGFRIEMGEIETQLNLYPDIKNSAVVVQGQDANKQLIAFYLANETVKDNVVQLDNEKLRAYLQQKLPEHMIPVTFVSLEFIPLSSSGKVERRTLEGIQVNLTAQDEYLAPDSDVEKKLADILGTVLNLDPEVIGLNDNFFTIGGNSITAVTLAANIEKIMLCKFLPVTLFKYNSIRSISEYINKNTLTKEKYVVEEDKIINSEFSQDLEKEQSMSDYPEYYRDSLAIIGMSCHFPEAQDHREFWENLRQGKESINHLTREEAANNQVSSEFLNNPDYVAMNIWLEGKECFDPEFFKISSGNAELMDPQFRQLLLHSWKAVEDAGYNCEDIPDTSVFMSAGNHFYQTLSESFSSQGNVTENSEEFVSWLLAQGGTIPTMISYQLGLTGASVFVHSNCSSSLTALYSAYQSLQSKDVDYALVGAASLVASQKYGYIYQSGMNLSSDGRCKTFDAKADGMVDGEGVSVVLLKRATDAIEAGDNIYSLLRGISINNDGSDKAGFYAPSVQGQSAVIEKVLDKTNINPESINYIEAHGTGTALGDPIEFMALCEAYENYTDKKQFCGIGSVKPNIGHLDTAAGLVGFVKLSLSLYHKKFPPIINYTSPNPQIDFDNSPFYVLDQEETWSTSQSPKRVALSSFGIGGTNTHAILEEYIQPMLAVTEQAKEKNGVHIIPLSAKKAANLQEYGENLLAFLTDNQSEDQLQEEINLEQLAYTLQTGRKSMEYRVIFLINNLDELLEALKAFVANIKSGYYLQGNISANRKSVELLAEDEDYQKLINHWLFKGKVDQLTKLWVKGTDLDWNLLYKENSRKPLRMSLPTYPFTRDKYWIENSNTSKQNSLLVSTNAGAISLLHPLLHSNTSDLGQQSYSSTFSGQEFFLEDHQINGQKILPAVAYLEMSQTAIIQAVPNKQASDVLELRNVVWAQPIVVDDHKEVTIGLLANDNDEIDYEIYSTNTDTQGKSQEIIHCQGQAIFSDDLLSDKLDIAQLQKQMQLGSVDIPSLYANYRKTGTNFGPAHQGVTAIHHGDQQLIAQLSLPVSVDNTSSDYLLHPSLMDAAFQACTVLIAGVNHLPSLTTLPFALESLRIISACTKNMFAWVRYSQGSGPDNKLIKVDIDLCDQDGNICVLIQGFSARVLTDIHDGKKKEAGTGTLIAATKWQTSALHTSLQTVSNFNESVGQRHIILCDLPKVDVNQLEGLIPHSRCSELQSAEQNISQHFNEYALACFEKIQTIIKSKPRDNVLIQIVIANTQEQALLTGMSGLLETAFLENPKLIGQLILTEGNITASQLHQKLVDEQSNLNDTVVKYKQNIRQVLRWQEIELNQNKLQVVFKDQGVYLITGGLGALGVLFAKEILQQTTKAKVILTGRSALSANEEMTRKQEIIEPLALVDSSEGLDRLEYKQLDISDTKQVQALITSIHKENSQLNGIIHSAGMISDNYILKKTSAEFSQVLEPKVTGTLNLDQASKGIDLDFFVLFSSESSLGSLGQADYASANGFMNYFAGYRNQLVESGYREGRTHAINWPLWQEGGMTIDVSTLEIMRETLGMEPMQTSTGIQAFYQCLELQHDHTLVMEGNLSKIRDRIFPEQKVQDTVVKAVAHKTEQIITQNVPTLEIDTGSLVEQTQDYLRKQFSALFKISSHQIDPQASLENYGIDSIMAINLTNQLEKTFGSLSKTILFEYQTIAELTEYFIESFTDKLVSLFGSEESSKPVITDKKDEQLASVDISSESIAQTRSSLTSGIRFSRMDNNSEVTTAANTNNASASLTTESIAIIGLSGRYPQAVNIDEYWHNLQEGKDCVTEIPKERWDWKDYFSEDRTKEGHHYSKWGGFIEGVDEFDPRFFNISPREATILDPQERIFLQHAWMAVEDAGYTRASLQVPSKQKLSGQVGVYVGVMYNEYQLFGAEASIQGNRMGFASNLADIANRVSHVLNLHGPSMSIDTMCSSSLTAIHLACQDLKLGRTDLAIAGGVNVHIHPNKYLIISSGQYVSSNGRCRSFGEGGDGYIPGEGVGAVLLKRVSEAKRDNDHVYGVIKGSSLSHGGKTNGYTVPNPQAQASAISQALAESEIPARHISYIEAHGTGTKLGDPIEINALTKAFYQDARVASTVDKEHGFCLIGSAKSNIGHCEPAAGIAGLTKILMQMKHKEIVPSLHSVSLNPHIDFDKTPFIVNQTLTKWEQPIVDGQARLRAAGVSSFGAGGSNAHMIIEEWPSAESASLANNLPSNRVEQKTDVIIPLSARTPEQLKQKVSDLLSYLLAQLDSQKTVTPTDMAYTLQLGREAMEERLGFIVSSIEQLTEKLQAYLNGEKVIEDVYQGQVKANKEGMILIGQDDDMKEAINKWLIRKKLSKLVDIWVKGLNLDWDKLYDEVKPQRISLPTYPFAKDKYWWSDTLNHKPSVITTKAIAGIHSLLHKNTSNFSQQGYSTTFTGEETFLTNSQNRDKILPTTAYLEMARVAVEQACVTHPELSTLELYNIAWTQPVIVKEQTTLDIALFANGDDAVDFEIYNQQNDIVFCQGHGLFSHQVALVKVELEQLKQQMREVNTSANNQEYKALYQEDNQLLVEFNLSGPAEHSNDYMLHPEVMNTALSMLLGLVTGTNSQDYIATLPLTLESVRINFACPENILAWVRYSTINGSQGTQLKLDIDFCDEQGQVFVQMQGLSYKIISEKLTTKDITTTVSSVTQVQQKQIANASVVPKVISFAPVEQQVFNEMNLTKPMDILLGKPAVVSPKKIPQTPLIKPTVKLSDTAFVTSTNSMKVVSLTDDGNGIFSLKIEESKSNNQLTSDVIEQIVQALTRLKQLNSVNVLRISGNEQSFLHGELEDHNNAIEHKLYQAIIDFPYPVVAVMQGAAKGAGFMVAALCDFMICSEEANYSYTSDKTNVLPVSSENMLFVERFGEVHARDFLYFSKTSTGKELQDKGWTCPILPQAEVETYAQKLVLNLASKSQKSLRLLKQHLARHLVGLVNELSSVNVVARQTEMVTTDQNAQNQITTSAKNLTLSTHMGSVLVIKITDAKTKVKALLSMLTKIFKKASMASKYKAIVIASEYPDFIPALDPKSDVDIVLGFQTLFLESKKPVIVALDNKESGISWFISQFSDACIYNENGHYGFDHAWKTPELVKNAAMMFTHKFGNYLSKEILLTGTEYSGKELQKKTPSLMLAEKDQILSEALKLAESWSQFPVETLVSFKEQTTLLIQHKINKLPDCLSLNKNELEAISRETVSNTSNNTSMVPELISLNSNVISVTVHSGGILVVKMEDRQEKNMHSNEILQGLIEVFEHIEQAPTYKVVILTGYDSYFSTGGTHEDLVAIQEGKAKFTDIKIYHLAMQCKLPVIAAMQGHGIGAGWSLGMFADFILFSEESKYLSPYMNFRFTPGAGATFVFPEKIGYDLARETLLTAQEFSGKELKDRGLLLPVVGRKEIIPAAMNLAAKIAQGSRDSLIAIKHQLTQDLFLPLEETFDLEVAMHEETFVGQQETLSYINKNFVKSADELKNNSAGNTSRQVKELKQDQDTTDFPKVNTGESSGVAHEEGLENITTSLKELLANELHMELNEIDEDAQFVDLGLDSIYGVTWIRKINERYQLSIEAITVYSYPTLAEFSLYVKEEIANHTSVSNKAEVSEDGIREMNVQANTTVIYQSSSVIPAQNSLQQNEVVPTAFDSNDLSTITIVLKKLLCIELHMDEEEIDDGAQFIDLGLDSIYGVTWIRKINDEYGLSIEAIKVYSYPTLTEFSVYVKEELDKLVTVPSEPEVSQSIEQEIHHKTHSRAVNDNSKIALAQNTLQANMTIQPYAIDTDMLSDITDSLKTLLANELHMQEEEIDVNAQFVDLGLDSIYGVTWVRKINEKYDISIEAIMVYSYPTLTEFSLYVKEEAEKKGSLIAPVSTVSAAPVKTINISQAVPEKVSKNITFDDRVMPVQAVDKLTSWRKKLPSRANNKQVAAYQPMPIAVIGMAGQFPQANNLEEFWENIATSKNCITEIPQDRWNIDSYYQEGNPVAGKTNSQWAGSLEQYDQFDPLFFNISPIEAESMDPQQRLFLQACWHSIENAGYNAKLLSGTKCGVYVGCAHGDYNQLSQEQHLSAQGFTGGAPSILSARISYFLNLQGPCISIDTACSSSLVAIANACDSLTSGASDLVLAGGVYVMTGPELHIRTAQSGMLSTDGKCYTFDQRANGFVPGEGVGVVMLKRLADAEKDQDIIQGVIQGWGVNQDGKTNGITAPNPVSQTKLQQDIYDKHQIDPAKIQLIEAHGTGTKLGDPIEIEGLKASFKKYTKNNDYCALGSVKSNIGHATTAAGVAGFIKIILAMKHKQLPPSINFEQLNEHINLKNSPFYVNNQLKPWQVENGDMRQAAISSFGFSGTNAHMVISEYVSPQEIKPVVTAIKQNSEIIVPLSAKTPEQLIQKACDLLGYIHASKNTGKQSFSDNDFMSLAYTLQVGREVMDERLGFMASSIEQLAEKLKSYIDDDQSVLSKIEGVYQGQVNGNKESMRIISQYDDVKDTIIEKWISSKNLSKLLDLWVKGLDLDWNNLYGDVKPKRINLPVYPFAKTRYWLETKDELRASSMALAVSSNILHPLVHRNTSDFGQQSYSASFSGEEFFLKDHRVNIQNKAEQKVLPGVAYLEMARAAIEDVMPMSEESGILELHNTAWVQPILVTDSKQVSIALFVNELEEGDYEQIDFEIYSQDEDKSVTHCQGQAVVSHEPAPAKLDIEQLKREMQRGKLEANEIYETFISIGLTYGPAHQGITSVYLGQNEALAQLCLPSVVEASQSDYMLHPCLMDSALQASVGLLSNLNQISRKPSIPFALDNLRIISSCTSEMLAWVRYSSGNQAATNLTKVDIDLIDQHGNVCVQMQGFSTRDLDGAAVKSDKKVINKNINTDEDDVFFDDAFYEKVIEGVLDNEISVEEAVELGSKI